MIIINKDNKNISTFIDNNIDKIWDYFNLKKEDIYINITSNYDEFRSIFFDNLNELPGKSTCGFILGSKKTVVVLSYEDYIKTHVEDYDAYLKMILHECVHVVHSIYCNRNYPIKCIWEGIATYLSDQYKEHSISDIPEEYLLTDKLSYVYYYSIMKLLIENFDKEIILKLLKKEIIADNYVHEIYKKVKNNS